MSKKLIFFLVSVLLAGLFCTATFAGKTVTVLGTWGGAERAWSGTVPRHLPMRDTRYHKPGMNL